MSKVITARQAVEQIRDGNIFAVDGFKCSAIPEEIFVRLRERYDATGLTFFSAPSMGAEGRGTDRLGVDGLISKFICSHAAISPSISVLAMDNRLRCYMIPMGNCVRMLQAAAGGEPGVIPHVGLNTFADPLIEASKANDAAKQSDETVVRRIELDGKGYLYYPAIHPDICFIKASYADPGGNTSFEREAMHLAQSELAAVTHNSGGKIEAGTIGGVPLGGEALGITVNPSAIYHMWDMLQVYGGGGIDAAFLGAAEIDQEGNVNISKFNGRIIGPGGFIDIAQNAKKICFMGTFTAVGLREHIEDGRLVIDAEGKKNKFKRQVEQITFSGKYALEAGQTVLYITERAVLRLTGAGLVLTEIAPGVDLERDILAHMDFAPILADDLAVMDRRIFRDEKMGLPL